MFHHNYWKTRLAKLFLLFGIIMLIPFQAVGEQFEEVYRDSRNTLTVSKCNVEWRYVVTGEVLIEAQFELINNTDAEYIIRRICLVVGDQWDIDDVLATNHIKRTNMLYSGKMEDPNRPGEFKDFWADIQTNPNVIAKIIAPGESITANFACILKRKKNIDNVQILLMDMCDKNKEKLESK